MNNSINGTAAHAPDQHSPSEEALRRSEERYRALVEATSQAVWSWSPADGPGDFSQTQHWWQALTGQTPEEQSASTTGWLDVVHPADRSKTAAAWMNALTEGNRYDIEYRVAARAGGWRHVHARGVPISNPDGTIREWVGTLDDVTEQRNAEAERRTSETRFQRLAEAGIMGVIRWDLERSLIVEANDEFLRMTGYDRSDLAAGRLDFRAMTPPEWTDRNERGIHELRTTGVGGAYEKEYFRKDGSRVPVIIVGVRFEDTPYEGMSFVMDITERKRIEQALREKEELLRLATVAAELGIWVWEVAEDRVLWENNRAYELFGLDRSTGPVNAARFLAEFVHAEDAEEFQRAVTQAVQGGNRFNFLGRMRRADGEIRWVEFTGLAVRAEDGAPLRMHGTAADITARKRGEAELRDSEERYRRAAATAATAAAVTPSSGRFSSRGRTLREFSVSTARLSKRTDSASTPAASLVTK